MSIEEHVGPAFPSGNSTPSGITDIDFFAAHALSGLLAHYGDRTHIVDDDSRIRIYAAAYDHAEEMLKEKKDEHPT